MKKSLINKLLALLLVSICFSISCIFGMSEKEWCDYHISRNFYYYKDLNSSEQQDLLKTRDFYRISGDKYSHFMEAAEIERLNNENAGKRFGVGFTMTRYIANSNAINNKWLISNIINDEYRSLIKKFDWIYGYSVDGKETIFYNENGELKPGNDFATLLQPILNVEPNKPFKLILKRLAEGGNAVWDSEVRIEIARKEFKNPVFIDYRDLSGDIGYIGFSGFDTPADKQFADAMNQFKKDGNKNLVLDMRDNGGGGLNILLSIAPYLVKDGKNNKIKILEAEYADKSRAKFSTEYCYFGNYNLNKIVVLADGGSASATESLIGAMKDYGTLTALIGTNTYGKGIMQRMYVYSKKAGLYLTVAKLYLPVSNISIHGKGFVPDIEVAPNYYSQSAYDNQLKAALNYLG